MIFTKLKDWALALAGIILAIGAALLYGRHKGREVAEDQRTPRRRATRRRTHGRNRPAMKWIPRPRACRMRRLSGSRTRNQRRRPASCATAGAETDHGDST